jgi:bacterioferritin-associated ferredoxin
MIRIRVQDVAMYVCICNAVTEREIQSAVEDGAHSLDCLRDELGVATSCGTCACDAQAVLDASVGGGSAAAGAPRHAPAERAAPISAAPVRAGS